MAGCGEVGNNGLTITITITLMKKRNDTHTQERKLKMHGGMDGRTNQPRKKIHSPLEQYSKKFHDADNMVLKTETRKTFIMFKNIKD